MPETTHDIPPTLAQLARATGSALLLAAAILVVIVLPAEYGIDPTGVGAAIGLKRLRATETPVPAAPAAGTQTTANVSKSALPLRSDEMSLTLAPGEGGEIKAAMQKDAQFVFSWSSTGEVKSDMHGEPVHAKENEFSSYWKEKRQSSGQGSFVAPFEGTHGWYWRNRSEQPVTITVKVTGFHDKLFRPS